jgi:hypothetical protein
MIAKNICTLFLVFSFSQVFSQQIPSNDNLIAEKMGLYKLSHQQGSLFIHTDKNIYTPNEQIWFSSYLLGIPEKEIGKHTTLQLSIINSEDNKVIVSNKYLIKNGLGSGDIRLADSIRPGKYILTALTDVVDNRGQPLCVYNQSITIKTVPAINLKSTLDWEKIPSAGDEIVKAVVKVSFTETKTGEVPIIQYSINNREVKTLPWKSPLGTISIKKSDVKSAGDLMVTVSYNGERQFLRLPFTSVVPVPKKVSVKFYPEGGTAVTGHPGLYAWEALIGNVPAKIKGILLENGSPIDSSSTNSYGAGRFYLNQKENAIYSLKISSTEKTLKDTSFVIPAPLSKGVNIEIKQAVVEDTLKVKLFSSDKTEVKVIVHDYNNVFAAFNTSVIEGGKSIKLALNAVPRGIAIVTVLDLDGRPIAERLFFAHFNEMVKTEITTDKTSYLKREPVHLKLKLKNSDGTGVQGLVSIAVVQQNRLDYGTLEDIENTFFLSKTLGNIPVNPTGRRMDNTSFLEDLLLIRGWREYKWQKLIGSTDKDTLVKISVRWEGKVLKNGKALTKPVQLNFMSSGRIGSLDTDQTGLFFPENEIMLNNDMKGVVVSVNDKDKRGFQIEINDPMILLTEKSAAQFSNTDFLKTGSRDTTAYEIRDKQNSIDLGGVTIKGNMSNANLYGTKGLQGTNSCGDYVDEFGYLNYPPSAGRGNLIQPERGKQYKKRTDFEGTDGRFKVEPIIYTGCQTDLEKLSFRFPGILLEKNFYGIDTKSEDSQHQSTLFWKAHLVTDENGQSSLDFLTGDLAGQYVIIIQGITNNTILYGSSPLTVK